LPSSAAQAPFPAMRIASRRVLLADGSVRPARLTVEGGIITEIETRAGEAEVELEELLLAPGLVDIHGDAFERQIMPRPGVLIDLGVALLETDRQLVANGITTAFHGITWSWEPGLRGTATGRALIELLGEARPALAAEHRVHVRYELHNLAGLDELVELVERGAVDLLAFNDHTPAILAGAADDHANTGYARRALVPLAEFNDLARQAAARHPECEGATAKLAERCRAAGVGLLSHDDGSPAERDRFRGLGAGICEFPKNRATAAHARQAGDAVVMGAPNILRGRSHLGWLSALEAIEADLCDVLASDYYYPALLQAPFRLAAAGMLPLARAWQLVAGNAARAAGLEDRGTIEIGMRADLVAVADDCGLPPRAVAGWRAGRPVYRCAQMADRS
jgi:alpha-D-ribose 1-methylphosphonate 5-triphosphate diphosphatase